MVFLSILLIAMTIVCVLGAAVDPDGDWPIGVILLGLTAMGVTMVARLS